MRPTNNPIPLVCGCKKRISADASHFEVTLRSEHAKSAMAASGDSRGECGREQWRTSLKWFPVEIGMKKT